MSHQFPLQLLLIDCQKQNSIMNRRQSRHTTGAIQEPRLSTDPSSQERNSSLSETVLCKITFLLDDNEEKQIKVYPNMTTYFIAKKMCEIIGCDYEECVEDQVKSQLVAILERENHQGKDSCWRNNLEDIINSKKQCLNADREVEKDSSLSDSFSFLEDGFERAMLKKKKWYFEGNQQKFPAKSNKRAFFGQKSDFDNLPKNIYERSQIGRQLKQGKISKMQQERQNFEISQCTFHPKINGKSKNKNISAEKTFERLYHHASQIRNKRNQRIKTLCSEEEDKLSELSFIPSINDCSRQICKMRSYTSLLSQEKDQKQFSKDNEKNIKITHPKTYTFEPQLSYNTKKITQNLPKFQQRLCIKSNRSRNKLSVSKSAQNIKAKPQPVHQKQHQKIKKQIFIIEDQSLKTEKKNVQPKLKKSNPSDQNNDEKIVLNLTKYLQNDKAQVTEVEQSTNKKKLNSRSEELYNNRKKLIFQNIFDYLTISPSVSTDFYRKRKSNKIQGEIGQQHINKHPYLPKFIKEMFSPMTDEMKQLSVTLEREEFIWAVEKLYEDLNVSDKGLFIGWGVKLLPDQNK